MYNTGVALAGIGRRVSSAVMIALAQVPPERKGGMPRLKQQRSWAKERFKVLYINRKGRSQDENSHENPHLSGTGSDIRGTGARRPGGRTEGGTFPHGQSEVTFTMGREGAAVA